MFREHEIPCIVAWNKSDLADRDEQSGLLQGTGGEDVPSQVFVSAQTGENIVKLREMIGQAAGRHKEKGELPLAGDLISPLDRVILVIPIDESAPKGRLILPQQQVLRDLLDHGAQVLCVRDSELDSVMRSSSERPSLVITDSQAFAHVAKVVPEDIPMTSFSILMARYKGVLAQQLRGVRAVDSIQDNDRILIAEGCTHHRQCGDIGTVKLPKWIREYTGRDPVFETSSGLSFPKDLERYKVVIHCGSCMLNEREVRSRNEAAASLGIPVTNYGMVIAQVHGILPRALRPVPEAAGILKT